MPDLCPRCFEPLGDKALVAVADGRELCAVCAAAKTAEDVSVDADLAQGLVATLLGQERGSVFLSSYVTRKVAAIEGAPASPPMDPVVAQGLAFVNELAAAAREGRDKRLTMSPRARRRARKWLERQARKKR